MKILLIEDNDRKRETTVKYLEKAAENLGIESLDIYNVETIMEAKDFIRNGIYDAYIIDMQLPNRRGGCVSLDGGIQILEYIDFIGKNNIRRVINTSSKETKELLNEKGYTNEKVIINSSMYDCSSSFNNFLKGE